MDTNYSLLPNYKIVDSKYFIKDKKLGSGSFAVTYLTLNQTGDVLACKMIQKKSIIQKIKSVKKGGGEEGKKSKDYLIQQLKNQVKTWQQLKHPNIVRFVDFSETSNNIYFFLEFCSQGHLQDLISKHGALPQPTALKLMKQIADGLCFLYQKGIFHRDIKPQNILIHQGIAKIADFGFAKVIQQAQLKDNPRDWTKVGTPLYMSPQILFGQPYNIKCDVWSLGLVFYKMLYGILPWPSHDMHQLMKNVSTKIPFSSSFKISAQLKNLIISMLEVNEPQRISIKDLQKALQSLMPQKMEIQ